MPVSSSVCKHERKKGQNATVVPCPPCPSQFLSDEDRTEKTKENQSVSLSGLKLIYYKLVKVLLITKNTFQLKTTALSLQNNTDDVVINSDHSYDHLMCNNKSSKN